jgi:hypothetical protein
VLLINYTKPVGVCEKINSIKVFIISFKLNNFPLVLASNEKTFYLENGEIIFICGAWSRLHAKFLSKEICILINNFSLCDFEYWWHLLTIYLRKMETIMAEELLTAGKIAIALEASPKKIKEAIEKVGLEADVIKAGCKYYNSESVEKIKAALED